MYDWPPKQSPVRSDGSVTAGIQCLEKDQQVQ